MTATILPPPSPLPADLSRRPETFGKILARVRLARWFALSAASPAHDPNPNDPEAVDRLAFSVWQGLSRDEQEGFAARAERFFQLFGRRKP